MAQERCYFLDAFEEGETIKVFFDLQGVEHEGKYMTILQALSIEKVSLKRLGVFKYQSEFDRLGLQNCPPSHYLELKMTSYRFVFQDLSHEYNFFPAFLANPARVNAQVDSVSKCQGLGLSLFQDKEEAKAHFREWMVKTRGKFAKNKGDHLAAIELELEDGVGSEPNAENFTHFTFHEYAYADLARKISQVEKI